MLKMRCCRSAYAILKNDVLTCAECEDARHVFLTQPPYGGKCLGCPRDDNVYCLSCTTEGCSAEICTQHSTCWREHVERVNPRKRHKHQKVDPFHAIFIDAVMKSETNEQRL